MTPREKENVSELIAVLRTFPFEELSEAGKMMGHLMGLAYMVLMQRRNVIEALENYATERDK
jgi:hypothetical protein